jgi:hypothetical protein
MKSLSHRERSPLFPVGERHLPLSSLPLRERVRVRGKLTLTLVLSHRGRGKMERISRQGRGGKGNEVPLSPRGRELE